MDHVDVAHPGFSTEQWLWIAGAWLVVCVIPAFIQLRVLKRQGNPIPEWWFTLTFLSGPLGLVAYWGDVKRNQRLAKRRGKDAPGDGSGP